MDDLISRRAAILETWREPKYTDPLNILTEMRDRLMNLPSAEPQIIQCKYCVHAQYDEIFHEYWCKGRKVATNHFCGYAERRTDE